MGCRVEEEDRSGLGKISVAWVHRLDCKVAYQCMKLLGRISPASNGHQLRGGDTGSSSYPVKGIRQACAVIMGLGDGDRTR